MFQAHEDQHHGGDDVGHDVVDGGGDEGDGVVVPHAGQPAKDEGAPQGTGGAPHGENHQGHCQPAVAVDAVVDPGAAHAGAGVHHQIQAAQAGHGAADDGGQIPVLGDADARCVGGGGAFAHGTQVQARPGPAQEVGQDNCQNHRQVDHEVVGEEELAHHRQVHQGGREHGTVEQALHRGAHRQEAGGVGVADGLPEGVAEAGAEHGQGQTGDVLVGPEGDGEHREHQGAQPRAHQGAYQGDDQGHIGVGPAGLLVVVGAHDAGDAAHEHHALHAQVQVAGLFGEKLAQHAEEEGGCRQDAGGEEVNEVIHGLPLLSPGRRSRCAGRSAGS